MVLSSGVLKSYRYLLNHHENRRNLNVRTRIRPGEECKTIHGRNVRAHYSYRLHALPAFHRELHGSSTSLGFRVDLDGGPGIVISGDTALAREPSSLDCADLANAYRGAGLVILHVGSLETDGRRLKEHLGLAGVAGILKKMCDLGAPAKLVVLSEWGYEFGRLGVEGRTRFTRLVVDELCQQGCSRYFAAVKGAEVPAADQIPIFPADVGLRIRLPDLGIWVLSEGFVDAKDARAHEYPDRIEYVSRVAPSPEADWTDSAETP